MLCMCIEQGEDKTTDEGDAPTILTTGASLTGSIKDLQEVPTVALTAIDDPEKKDEILEGKQQVLLLLLLLLLFFSHSCARI